MGSRVASTGPAIMGFLCNPDVIWGLLLLDIETQSYWTPILARWIFTPSLVRGAFPGGGASIVKTHCGFRPLLRVFSPCTAMTLRAAHALLP